tara:strand:+ start:711 stop:2711 length:2001 start_codon:yes stop_codon:yes gene_type:complete
MQNYFIILIVLIGNIFSMPNNRKETVLLIEVNSQIQSLKIINSEQYLVDYLPFNKYLIDSGVNKIEKWNNAASDNDIYNEINFSKIYRVFFKENSSFNLENIKANFERSNYINNVEYDYYRKVNYTPNDPRYNNQWFLQQIHSNDAWDIWDISNGETPGNQSIILSSVDLGVNWQHPDLVGNLWQNLNEDADGDGHTIEYIGGQWVLDPGDLNGIDDDNWDNNMSTFIDDLVGWDVAGSTYGDNDPDVPNNGSWAHGTHVAGLLSATTNNNTGIASSAFNCSVMSIKCTAESEDPSYISNGFDGVLYAAKAGYYSQGFSIINCSWGGTGYNMFEQELINMCTNEYNALIFAAAGNDNIEQAHYPSSYEDVISVTALGQNNSWNHWATYHNTVDLASPGESIQSCVNNGSGYSSWTGTSMASPVAASVAGLMKSLYPSWGREQIRTMIIETANPIIYQVNPEQYIQGKLGSGRVDALNAVITPLFPKIELAEIDLFIQDDFNDQINIGETIELTAIFLNDSEWGMATNPNITIDCDSDDINVVNQFIALENIPSGEATINFEPIIIEFDLNIEPNLYECNINLQSNTNSYIQYNESFVVEFDVNDFPILLGDINEDGIIDILDVIVCVNIVIELVEPTLSQLLTSDINQDGNTNVQDIILMVNLILN